MAISAASVFEVRSAGADTNGGGFVTGIAGTDYSQQNAKNTGLANDNSTTDVVATGSTTITSAGAAFSTLIIGNIIYLQGGTGSLAAGWYQVVTRTSATQVVLDRSVAAGNTITMNIGGALASPGMAGGAAGGVSGVTIYIKTGTYVMTVSTANVSNGAMSGGFQVLGYNTSRTDFTSPPTLQWSVGSVTIFAITLTAAGFVQNIIVDGNSQTTARGISISGTGINRCYACEVKNCVTTAFSGGTNGGAFIACWSHNNTNAGFTAIGQCGVVACVSNNNGTDGFTCAANTVATECIAYSNGQDGFNCSGTTTLSNCTSYGNTRDGFRMGQVGMTYINCIAESNTGVGFNASGNNNLILMYNCAGFSAGTNVTIGTGKQVQNIGFITGTASFFVNAASGNFALNNTASAGAALRGLGFPGTFLTGLTVGFLDVGAVQHQDTGGGGGATSAAYFG
jgi:hypothetical protein